MSVYQYIRGCILQLQLQNYNEQTEYEFIPPSHPLMEAIITQGNLGVSHYSFFLFV